jgi:hypothetical protein
MLNNKLKLKKKWIPSQKMSRKTKNKQDMKNLKTKWNSKNKILEINNMNSVI